MAIDMNAVAAMAAKAKGAEASSVGELPDNADDYITQLVDDEVLDLGQATALRLLIGKAKVEAVAEAVRRAAAGAGDPTAVAEIVSQNQEADTSAAVAEKPPEIVEAAAQQFDEMIERRRQAAAERGEDPDQVYVEPHEL